MQGNPCQHLIPIIWDHMWLLAPVGRPLPLLLPPTHTSTLIYTAVCADNTFYAAISKSLQITFWIGITVETLNFKFILFPFFLMDQSISWTFISFHGNIETIFSLKLWFTKKKTTSAVQLWPSIIWNWYQLFLVSFKKPFFFVSQSYFTNHWHICWTRWLCNDCNSVQLHMIVFYFEILPPRRKIRRPVCLFFIKGQFLLLFFLDWIHVCAGILDAPLVTAWAGTCSFRFPNCGPDRWANPTL